MSVIHLKHIIENGEFNNIMDRYASEIPQIKRAIRAYLFYKRTWYKGIRKICDEYQVRSWLFNLLLQKYRLDHGLIVKCPYCKNGKIRAKLCHICHGMSYADIKDLKQIQYIIKKNK